MRSKAGDLLGYNLHPNLHLHWGAGFMDLYICQTHGAIHVRPGHVSVGIHSILIAVIGTCRGRKVKTQVLKGYT